MIIPPAAHEIIFMGLENKPLMLHKASKTSSGSSWETFCVPEPDSVQTTNVQNLLKSTAAEDSQSEILTGNSQIDWPAYGGTSVTELTTAGTISWNKEIKEQGIRSERTVKKGRSRRKIQPENGLVKVQT